MHLLTISYVHFLVWRFSGNIEVIDFSQLQKYMIFLNNYRDTLSKGREKWKLADFID